MSQAEKDAFTLGSRKRKASPKKDDELNKENQNLM
jgi:hypothetical protein